MPPIGGVTVATPPNGTQFNTTFTLTQSGWYDEDTPLTYGFDYSTDPATSLSNDCRPTAAGW